MNAFQLKLCDIQGRLFELSAEKKYSSAAFIKIFMSSDTAKELDSEYNRMQWAGEEYLLEEVAAGAGDMLYAGGEIFSKVFFIGSVIPIAIGITTAVRIVQQFIGRHPLKQ